MITVRLLGFYAGWYGPCRTQSPILNELEGDRETIEFVKVDVDEGQGVASQYQVRLLPALIVGSDDDGIVNRFVGVTQHNDIESVLNQAGA